MGSGPVVALEEAAQLKTLSGTIYGTLLTPETKTAVPVVLLIAGSGLTDRNGNIGGSNGNNSLKLLAEARASNGIGSLRYDKRGIGESAKAMRSESEIRFDNYVDDAAAWVEQLRKDPRFSRRSRKPATKCSHRSTKGRLRTRQRISSSSTA